MLWDNSAQAGFTTGKPWLPINDDAAVRNLAAQKNDPQSIWRWHQQLLALRKQHAALRLGDWKEIYGGKNVLAYRRTHEGQSIDVFLNFSRNAVELPPVEGKVLLSNMGRVSLSNSLSGYEVLVMGE